MQKEDKLAYSFYAVIVIIAIAMSVSGCHKKRLTIPDKDGSQVVTPMEPVAEKAVSTEPEKKSDLIAPVYPVITDKMLTISKEKSIYFDYDRWTITKEAVDELETVTKYLNRTGEKINISGNCDERGTIEYNQVLGMRRSNNVRSILLSLGLNPDSINSVVSYGKERPVCQEHSEDCWKLNRRVDVVVVR